MKRKDVRFVEKDMMILDKQGNDYTTLELDENPESVLHQVNKRLKEYGLKVTVGADEDLGNSDYYFFRIDPA